MGRAPSLSASAGPGCLRTRGGSQKPRAPDCPQINPSCFEHSPPRQSPPVPSGISPGHISAPSPAGAWGGPSGTQKPSCCFQRLYCPRAAQPPPSPLPRPPQQDSILPQTSALPPPALICNDVQTGLGHGDQAGAQRLGGGTRGLLTRGRSCAAGLAEPRRGAKAAAWPLAARSPDAGN